MECLLFDNPSNTRSELPIGRENRLNKTGNICSELTRSIRSSMSSLLCILNNVNVHYRPILPTQNHWNISNLRLPPLFRNEPKHSLSSEDLWTKAGEFHTPGMLRPFIAVGRRFGEFLNRIRRRGSLLPGSLFGHHRPWFSNHYDTFLSFFIVKFMSCKTFI